MHYLKAGVFVMFTGRLHKLNERIPKVLFLFQPFPSTHPLQVLNQSSPSEILLPASHCHSEARLPGPGVCAASVWQGLCLLDRRQVSPVPQDGRLQGLTCSSEPGVLTWLAIYATPQVREHSVGCSWSLASSFKCLLMHFWDATSLSAEGCHCH